MRQTSVKIGEIFRKIHQTTKISAQQCCHAAKVFVTLHISIAKIMDKNQTLRGDYTSLLEELERSLKKKIKEI